MNILSEEFKIVNTNKEDIKVISRNIFLNEKEYVVGLRMKILDDNNFLLNYNIDKYVTTNRNDINNVLNEIINSSIKNCEVIKSMFPNDNVGLNKDLNVIIYNNPVKVFNGSNYVYNMVIQSIDDNSVIVDNEKILLSNLVNQFHENKRNRITKFNQYFRNKYNKVKC